MVHQLFRLSASCPVLLAAALALAVPRTPSAQGSGAAPPQIPLREGLTIVTAVGDPRGDFESIKRITRIDAERVRVEYSADLPPVDDADPLSQLLGGGCRDKNSDPKKRVHGSGTRIVIRKDLESARQYHPYFEVCTGQTHEYAGTTALGVSTTLLRELKTTGQTKISVASQGLGGALGNLIGSLLGAAGGGGAAKAGDEDLDFDTGTITRVEREPVKLKVIVNDQPVELPAIHARGRIGDDASEFWFLDDPANPLSLKWSMGDGKHLQAVKISFPPPPVTAPAPAPVPAPKPAPAPAASPAPPAPAPTPTPAPASAAASTDAAARIERELNDEGRAVVYGIYFDFASDRLKPESQPVLADIAKVMKQHPAWSLSVEGHTDNIGGDPYNLDLSKRRAAAVKQALVGDYQIEAKRLDTSGYGASRPKDTNATIEGRARNRRVELVKR
jgi:outer membrane protein OmpA-like peptidoglycan-associated protein